MTTSTVTTANGVETVRLEKIYDALNRVTEQIDADGLSTKAEYDALGRQTATIDKLGNRSAISYDARNLPVKQVGPDGHSSASTYDAAGRMLNQTEANGNTTQYEYDAVGNVKKVINADGTFVEHAYDTLGRLLSTTSSTGLSTSREYDAAGRLIAETDVLGRTTRYEYDADGKRQKMIDPRGNVFEFEYDARGHQTAMSFPDGSRVTYQYNEQGKKTAETDQLGQTKYFAWNDLGLLKTITDPLGHATSYNYNEIGNLLSQTDANGHMTNFDYNKLGRRTKKTYPLGMSQNTSYDVANRSVSVTDFNGQTTTSQYDNLGRVVTTTFADGMSMSYSYTSSGQIASVSGPQGTSRYSYDGDGRLGSVTDPNGATVSYSYDALGRKKAVTVPSGTTEYDYDDFGRLTSVTGPDGEETRYTYDEHGNKASLIYPNGTITEYGYDNLNRLTFVETRTITGTVLASYSYTLNAKGQRTHVEEQSSGRTIDYDYDAADRLIEERISDPVLGNRVITYTYDPVGNRLTKDDNGVITEYTYDDNDRLLTENGYAYTYDNNGNMLTKNGNGETWQLEYNALNQLAHANITTPQGSSTIDYTYDHDGIRIGKTINGTDVIQYVVDKNRPYAQVLEEERSNGMLSAATSYVYGDALLSASTEGVTQYYHVDGMGSVRGLSDMNGNLTDKYAYDAYGMLQHHSGASDNLYRYRGEQYDSDLDAYYLRARYYQPGIGRFLTTDPIEGFPTTPMSLHRYLYGNDNPVSMIDQSGELTMQDALVATLIVNDLAGLAVLTNFRGFQDFYVVFAQNVLPDAYIIGANMNISKKIRETWNYILSLVGMPHYVPTDDEIYAGELLFSISSGEIALFEVTGTNVIDLPVYACSSLYEGVVFNLWDADDYSGEFISIGVGVRSLFSNPRLGFKGLWGVGYDIRSSGISPRVAGTSTSYTMFGSPRTSETELAVALALFPLSAIPVPHLPVPITFFIKSTMWTQTAIAKYYWNKKEGHPPEYRRLNKRPPDFQSGPNGVGWYQGLQYLMN